MRLDQFNALSCDEAMKDLRRCCGSRRWAVQMAARRPFRGVQEVLTAADQVWSSCDRQDAVEAFRQQPRIEEVAGLRPGGRVARSRGSADPGDAGAAAGEVMRKLAAGGELYEKKFGYPFVVCATGKTAAEMLEALEARLGNRPEAELKIAAGEQAGITRIRLGKLLQDESLNSLQPAPV